MKLRILLLVFGLLMGSLFGSSLARNQTAAPADPGLTNPISDPAIPGDATTQPANIGPDNNNTEYVEGTITKLLPLLPGSKDQGRDLEVKLGNGQTVRECNTNQCAHHADGGWTGDD